MPEQLPPACPHCGHFDQTYKISLLYLECSARLHQKETINQPELDGMLNNLGIDVENQGVSPQLLSQMIQWFAPPEGEKQVTRTIHPDFIVLVFGLVAVFLVYQVSIYQSSQFPIAVIILAAAGLAYLLARKTIVTRYQARMIQEQETNRQVEQAINRWMRLYYCSRDQGIFNPDLNRFVPIEQMRTLLSDV